ncbi:MAG: type II secretion system protein [Patescibacteria group bacterium]
MFQKKNADSSGPSFEKSKIQFLKTGAGFTLLEMIVSIGIFLTALIIILGALVSINEAARKARSERIVADNLSAAVDSMSRSIRVGSNFHCDCTGLASTTPKDCAMTDDTGLGGDACLVFEGQQGDSSNQNDQIAYKLSGGSIERSTDNGATYLPLTAPELSITSLKFYVYGTTPSDDQPVVTMIVRGSAATTQSTKTNFDVQTTVSAYTPSFTFP